MIYIRLFTFYLCYLTCVCSIPSIKNLYVEDILHNDFINWKSNFNKYYYDKEHNERFVIFKNNIDFINKHNKLYENGVESFYMNINQFTDMSNLEFSYKMNGYKEYLKNTTLKNYYGINIGNKCTHYNITDIPDSIDWRQQNAVTEIKNQGQCGSCWSFSTTGALEGAWKVAGNGIISLSEEELVQCDKKHDNGCNGGIMENAYEWVIKNGGITTEKNYPYTSGNGINGKCNYNKSMHHVVTITDYCELNHNDEKDLEKALVQQPIAVGIEADKKSFQFYSGGIFPAIKCGSKLDHGVLAFGYGIDNKKNMKYWIVKNSWGESWGDNGYIKLEKDPSKKHHKKISTCGIAKAASYPVV